MYFGEMLQRSDIRQLFFLSKIMLLYITITTSTVFDGNLLTSKMFSIAQKEGSQTNILAKQHPNLQGQA